MKTPKTAKSRKNGSPESRRSNDQGAGDTGTSPKKGNKGRSDSIPKFQAIETFCQAIMSGKTQSDAYREAFPKSQKWKNEAVHNKAYEFAQLGEVRVRLEELARQQASKYEQDVGKIMDVLRSIAFSDPRKLFDEHGKLKPLKEIPEDVLCAVSSIEVDGNGKMRTRVLSNVERMRALDLLGRFYKIWSENHSLTVEKSVINIQGVVITKDMDPVEASKLYRDLVRNGR